MRLRAAMLVAGLLAIGACTSHPGTDIVIRCGLDGTLTGMTVDGLRLDRTPGEPAEAFVKRALAKVRQPVQVKGDGDVPYRCIGGAIFSMQGAGVSRIGFLSEQGNEAARLKGNESRDHD